MSSFVYTVSLTSQGSVGFIVNNILGVIGCGSLGSSLSVHKGVELTMLTASQSRVDNSSVVRCLFPRCTSAQSRPLLIWPILRSHTPPKWEEWGGLNIHSKFSFVNWATIFLSVMSRFWEEAPTKLVPLSLLIVLHTPRIAKNRLRAFMNDGVSREGNISICTAWELKQVKITAQTLVVPL